jgi:hypothetical protein
VRRVRRAYELQFRQCLEQLGARKIDAGIPQLFARAERRAAREGISPAHALVQLAEEIGARARGLRSRWQPPAGEPTARPRFWCDSGLGGLARWLRATGHEAFWAPRIPDSTLLHQAQEQGGVIITTDSLLMERRCVRTGLVQVLWLPPALAVGEQLAVVFRRFRLRLEEPRCMNCGGQLRRVDKEAVRERIPPRTYRWLDEYFVCCQCDQLFWHGTHWRNIQAQLHKVG